MRYDSRIIELISAGAVTAFFLLSFWGCDSSGSNNDPVSLRIEVDPTEQLTEDEFSGGWYRIVPPNISALQAATAENVPIGTEGKFSPSSYYYKDEVDLVLSPDSALTCEWYGDSRVTVRNTENNSTIVQAKATETTRMALKVEGGSLKSEVFEVEDD